MRDKDKTACAALGSVFADDIAMSAAVDTPMLGQEWLDFCEAMALACFASGDIERKASIGALVYTASRLP